MKIAVCREVVEGERRVALVPSIVKRLVDEGAEVFVQSEAGSGIPLTDRQYTEAGATVVENAAAMAEADLLVKVAPPTVDEITKFRSGQALISFLKPLDRPELLTQLAQQGVTAFAMELVPRTTRAQAMDALSSQATVSGYKAVLLAADRLNRFLPMLTTAAGTIRPAKVLVLGAGVAGLQAIASARRLGAVVTAFDVRAAVREQVESLGAKFLEVEISADAEGEGGYAKAQDEETQRKQRELIAEAVIDSDIVITTALIPGKPAPLLVEGSSVERMRSGSVIVDLAGEAGGNCELSKPGEDVVVNGVQVLAPLNLPSGMSEHASQLYARNVYELSKLLVDSDSGQLKLDFEDDIVAGACVTHNGEVRV